MTDFITITGLEARRKELEQLVTSSPSMKKYLQGIIRKCIGEARKNVVKDAQGVLDNDPRHAYKAVRNSVYKQIFGGQINILSSRKRGAPTRYQRPRKLDENPHKRGGDLVSRVGLKITAKAETEQKFNDLLMSFKPKNLLKGIVERAYVEKKDNTPDTPAGGDDNQGGGNQGGGELEP